MIKNILCPIDRSLDSIQAFAYAIALAKWQGARLKLLEVIETAPPPGASRARKDEAVPKKVRTDFERDLRRMLVARRASDLKVEIFMRKGNVVEEILAQARASRSELVVMGSHGRGGARRLVLGSVAEKVLRLAACPVLTVRRGVKLTRRGGSPFARILCATDFSPTANRAVTYARELAKEAGADLIVMSAVEWPFSEAVTSRAGTELRESAESEAREALDRLLPRSSSDRSGVESVVAFGRAGAAILGTAREREVDLIVMGVSGRDATDTAALGSNTHRVIREGTSPVLTVRAALTSRRPKG